MRFLRKNPKPDLSAKPMPEFFSGFNVRTAFVCITAMINHVFISCILLFIVKEIKHAPECIVELYKRAEIFKNTREVHREARGAAALTIT